MNKKITFLLSFLFSVGLLSAQNSGDLDVTFGNNGKLLTDIGQADFTITSQATQTDGKIILAGRFNNFNNVYGFIIRVNTDGTLDTTFNGTGRVLNESVAGFQKLILQSDGKILVGGGDSSGVAVARYLTDGTPDASFGDNGQIISDTENNSSFVYFVDFAQQADGKIVVLSYYNANQQDYRLTRLNTNGTIDTSFGTNGATISNIGAAEITNSIAILGNDKIVVNGINIGTDTQAFVAKYTASGVLDTTFNTTGFRLFTFTGTVGTRPSNVIAQADGKLLFANEVYSNSLPRVYLIRLTVNGNYDTTFDSDGIAIANAPDDFFSNKGILKLLPTGKYMYFTETSITLNTISYRKATAFRFNSNGSADATFDNDGQTVYTISNLNDNIADFSVANDGNVVFSGNADLSFFQDGIYLCKINGNGSLNTGFSTDGKVELFFPYPAYDELKVAKLQADGKIVAAGVAFFNDELRSVVLRYNANGTLDTSFADNGILRLFNQAPYYNITDIEILPNGKIIVAAGDVYSYVLQLNANGTVDTTFGTNGFVLFTNNFTTIYDVEVLSTGKILLAGDEVYSIGSSFTENYKLTRLNANGTFDTTFGTGGTSNIPSTTAVQETIFKIKALASGKIIAAGTIFNGNDADVIVFRYNSNGTLDTTFNGNGSATFGGPEYDYPTALLASPNGKITVCSSIGENEEALITRFNSNGEFDTTFDTDGNLPFAFETINFPKDLHEDTNGKLLISGSSNANNDSNFDFTIVRVNNNGDLDGTFADGGKLTIDFDNTTDGVMSLLVSGNTAIAAGFGGETQSTTDFAFAKFFIDTVLSTSEFEKAQNTFYPNPAAQFITLNETITKAEIFTIDGKSVPTKMNGNRIDVNQLPNGIYLVNLTYANNETKTEKLIVRH
ncbi:T9SS type A sorting domain-containing protein [Flavobacterium sp.]|uniref:T9SS type A sorting domain-containing protein n=1 Tax=Flavobacterium sp. TaxID=239 RepID=UPI002621FA30|nr:T9SS type A sorting domain-containing protein [Flavobacterium sp.]